MARTPALPAYAVLRCLSASSRERRAERQATPCMRGKGRNIIVVGTSAGGLETLDELVGQLPTGLRASMFIVQHMAPESSGLALLRRLSRHKAFEASLARNGHRFTSGRIYIAP